MTGLRLHSPGWSIERTPALRAGGLRSAEPASSFPADFLTDESAVAGEFIAQPTTAAQRRAASAAALDFSCDLPDGESAVLALRHPSGA